MLVMIVEGRLGNQVFQYLALRASAQPRELVVMLGCEDLATTFDGVRARVLPIDIGPLRHLRSVNRGRFARWARSLHLGGLLTESDDALPVRDSLHGLVMTDRAWFQTSALLDDPAIGHLRIKDRWKRAASQVWERRGLDPLTTIVVHARGGDYRSWPSPESPALLPPAWFARQVGRMRASRRIDNVLVVGDDHDYCIDVHREIPGSVMHHDPGPTSTSSDLALLAQCPQLVISPSTFGFWGAWFSRQDHPQARVIAPLHWAGHRKRDWYPRNIKASFIEYQDCLPLDHAGADG